MYSYTFDEETGGILLNSSPTIFSKEPRPVYASEMNLLGFNLYWNYENQDDVPYLWAESATYWYRNVILARIKGGDLYTQPELIPETDENGNIIFSKNTGYSLLQINLELMCQKNLELMKVIQESTIKRILKEYEKFKNKLDIFHVAFSGGKDSAVLLDLVKKALPQGSFVVIFGDTGMEFPDTYEAMYHTKELCEKEQIPFYIAKSHFDPQESWHIFGPPARVLRWCCSVHKSTPQTILMRQITGKNNYLGLDFVGVRAYESVARSKYDYESYGKKQKGQYSYNPILEWTSAEIWMYIYAFHIYVNATYKKGNSRAGCLFCPMGGGKGDYLQYKCYPNEVQRYLDMIYEMNARNAGDPKGLATYVSHGGWNARKNGRDITLSKNIHYSEEIKNNEQIITLIEPKNDWHQWIKPVGSLPFEYAVSKAPNGVEFRIKTIDSTSYSKELRKFKLALKKAAYCIGCRVCEINCHNGSISFDEGLKITDCIHCGQCLEIDDGCLVYHSLKVTTGEGKMITGSINSFANHAPQRKWVEAFFTGETAGNKYWDSDNGLGPNQKLMFKKFLKACNLIDSKNQTTELFNLVSSLGWDKETTWGILLSNLIDNRQIRWYIDTMKCNIYYQRSQIADLLMLDGLKKEDATSVILSFKRFVELPLGTELNWGHVEGNDKQTIEYLCRTKCVITDYRVFLYALYRFIEKCNFGHEIHLSYLMDDTVERDGVSPVRLFGYDNEDELKKILLGLSAAYPDFIQATFTNDLKTITLSEKTSQDVLSLF